MMIDWQALLLWVLGFCCIVGGWFLRTLWDAVDALKSDLLTLSADVSRTYVRRDDYRDDMKELKTMVSDIWQTIHNDQRQRPTS